MIAATNQLAMDTSFVGTATAGGNVAYQQPGFAVTVSSNWQPVSFVTENTDNTSQVTTYNSSGYVSNNYSGPNGTGSITSSQVSIDNSDGSTKTTSYAGANGTGSITSSDQENVDGTSQITTYNPVFNPGSSTTTTYSGPNGTGSITKIDQENTTNYTSQITTYNPDGSSVTKSYSGPNGTGSITKIDQENSNGTSVITTYGPGGPTTINYSGPNGTGTVTKITIQGSTGSIVSQTSGIAYSYTGHEIYTNTSAKLPEGTVTATATFAISAGFTGSAQPTANSLTALGQTLTNATPYAGAGAPTTFSFVNGQITQWTLEHVALNLTIATIDDLGSGGGATDSAGYSQNYTGPNPVTAFNTNSPGTWSASFYQTTVTISPLAGQTQQLASVLSNSALTAQGAIQNITVNGPGIVGVTGSVTVPASGGQGTFTDNGTVNLGALGTNVLNLNNVTLAGSGFIQQQGENDATYVSAVSGVDFAVSGGTLTLANPTGFNGTIGPISATSGAAAMGTFGQVDIMNAMNVAKGSFDTTTGMLSLLNSAGSDMGDIHFGGVATGLRLTQEPARGSSSAYLAINDQGTGGNIPLTFHA